MVVVIVVAAVVVVVAVVEGGIGLREPAERDQPVDSQDDRARYTSEFLGGGTESGTHFQSKFVPPVFSPHSNST